MSVPVRLTAKITVDKKKIGAFTLVSLNFQMRTEDANRAFSVRDGLAEAFIAAIRLTDEELMR